MRKLFGAAAAIFMVMVVTGMAHAQSKTKTDILKSAEKTFKYVGEKTCKTCHRVEYDSWQTTKHANAWAALKPEEQKRPECVSCHATGTTATDSLLVNVSCESCHGPGSEYKSMKNMKDPKLAASAGLLPVTEATCLQCHNKDSPTFKGFDFAGAMMVGVHKTKPKTPGE